MIVAALASAGLACSRDEVAHFRIPKSAPASGLVASGATPGGPLREAAMAGEVAPPPAPTGASALRWTLPSGWTQSLAGGMRYATLKPPTPGRIEVSVVVLPGPAGGELANVNRWRGQIGLAPIDEPALAAARRNVSSKAGPVSVYDFVSNGQEKARLIAALASAEGNSWFVKMVGDAGPVGAARPDFIRLLESLRFDAAN